MGNKQSSTSAWTTKVDRSTVSGVISGGQLASDPTSDVSSGRRSYNSGAGGIVQIGKVIRSGVGVYDCAVRIGSREIGCQVAGPVMAAAYGYSIASVPTEGSFVVVMLPSMNAMRGFVLGILPLGWMVAPNDASKLNLPSVYDSEDKAGYGHYAAFTNRIVDSSTYSAKIASPNNRPSDILQGEFGFINEHSCGFFGGVFSANIYGGAATIKVSRIDDMIRVRSENYERWSDESVLNEYNDWAYLTSEEQTFSYQGERLGDKGLTASGPIIGSAAAPAIVHPRMLEFKGALGVAETKFVQRPEQNRITKDSKEKKPEDEGVFSSHTSEAGELMCRSAGGLSFERYDRIPIVRRIRKPYDPEGDKEVEHKPIKPFKHNDEDPAFRPLELFDALAWEQKGVYQRFDEQKKDYRTQEEQEIKTPSDTNFDPPGSSSDMQKNEKRRCGIYLEQNGGITIRDAWGSEISLVGGNIYLNAPGSIVMTANRSIVSFANDSNVMKSKKIAAIESMKYVEMRGVSYVNIQGGYTGGSGGVLIESFGEDDIVSSPPGAGHDTGTKIRGITLKSGSGLNFRAKNMRATVDKDVLVGCGEKGERNGRVIVSGGEFHVISEKSFHAGTEKAAFYVQDDKIFGLSDGGVTFGTKGAVNLIQDTDKIPVISWVKAKSGVDGPVVERELKKVSDLYEATDPKEIVKNYAWEDYDERICSQLGKSYQYEAHKSLDLRGGKFRMYLPYWHTMKNDGNELLADANPEPWTEYKYPVYGNMAWPGKESIDGGETAFLEKSVNLNNQYSVKRDALKDSTPVQVDSFINRFRV